MSLRSIYSFACAGFAAVVAAGSLAGCFSERGATAPPTGAELCTGTQPANVVRIVDFSFQPATLTVARGTTVRFVNCGTQQHTSTSDASAWNSGLLSTHVVFERAFDAAGSFPYHCNPHPSMRATVVVN